MLSFLNNSMTGVIYDCSRVRISGITDGTTNTLLLGERAITMIKPSFQFIGMWNFGYTGMSNFDTTCPPNGVRKYKGMIDQGAWWLPYSTATSLHAGGANFAMCDGSVRFVKSSTNMTIIWALGTRDGASVRGGDLDNRVPPLPGHAEFARLGADINAMTDTLAERQKQIEDDLRRLREQEAQRRLAASVFEQAREAITITDADANILTVSRRFTEITGYTAEEVIGRNPRVLQSGRHDAAFYRALWSALTSFGHWNGEIWNKRVCPCDFAGY